MDPIQRNQDRLVVDSCTTYRSRLLVLSRSPHRSSSGKKVALASTTCASIHCSQSCGVLITIHTPSSVKNCNIGNVLRQCASSVAAWGANFGPQLIQTRGLRLHLAMTVPFLLRHRVHHVSLISLSPMFSQVLLVVTIPGRRKIAAPVGCRAPKLRTIESKIEGPMGPQRRRRNGKLGPRHGKRKSSSGIYMVTYIGLQWTTSPLRSRHSSNCSWSDPVLATRNCWERPWALKRLASSGWRDSRPNVHIPASTRGACSRDRLELKSSFQQTPCHKQVRGFAQRLPVGIL